MIATVLFNETLGFIMVITLCFCLGDLNRVMDSLTGAMGYPFIEDFHQGVQSVAGATVMTSILIVLLVFCCITNIATASRQLFAFARDKGVPFSRFFSYVGFLRHRVPVAAQDLQVPSGCDIPFNAILFTVTITILLSLINIGSEIAYNNITSLGVCVLLSSYSFDILRLSEALSQRTTTRSIV